MYINNRFIIPLSSSFRTIALIIKIQTNDLMRKENENQIDKPVPVVGAHKVGNNHSPYIQSKQDLMLPIDMHHSTFQVTYSHISPEYLYVSNIIRMQIPKVYLNHQLNHTNVNSSRSTTLLFMIICSQATSNRVGS